MAPGGRGAPASDIDRLIYRFPKPEDVAKLLMSEGMMAARERWHFMSEREIQTDARVGRSGLGSRPPVRQRSASAEQEAAAIEAAFALGTVRVAEIAAGMKTSAIRAAFNARRLAYLPTITPELRGRATQDSKDAARGDEAAAARIEARAAHAAEVYGICLAPEQPAYERPRLPEPTPELAVALAGFERTAVATVFPTLPDPPTPEPASEEPPVPAPGQTNPRRLLPPDDEIRRQHAETPSPRALAQRWAASESTVFTRLRRPGLTRPRGGVRLPVPAVPRSPSEDRSIGVYAQPGEPRLIGRLGVEDLVVAIELARRAGIALLDALTWVHADAGLANLDSERTA